ncbi:hypothetical protein DPMN_104760 [Dreissena polymorpha]|uniref:Uncharacterized protein n=1 Tax=Dreissena polymorpha TaxID=45954 RepID=A0A9D4HB22_DREPO|nr:hypothetical protein DPMN_104760 [Dreissena polymorpha]
MAALMENAARGEHEQNFEERFTSKYVEDRMYSVIISGDQVKQYFNPSTLAPKIVKLTERGQEMRNRSNVLMTEYVTSAHLDKVSKDNNKYRMLQWPVTNWATPIGIYHNLTRADAEKVNTLKRILNYNNCALIMHDGTSDDACRINGFHVHLIVQNDTDQHLCKGTRWRTARSKLLKFCTVKTAKIVEHKDFFRHIFTPPRVFMGANNIELKNRLLTVYLREKELQLYKQQLKDIELAAQLTLLQADETM